MARPTTFIQEQALDKAMKLFWRQGYATTSLSQLVEEMGISRSSLYSTFGDKKSLLKLALERYNAGYNDIVKKISLANDPAYAIWLYFSQMYLQNDTLRLENGCLIVNSLLEFSDVDPELAQLAQDQLNKVNTAFRQCFRQASENREY